MTEKETVELKFLTKPRMLGKPKKIVSIERIEPKGMWDRFLSLFGIDRATYNITVQNIYTDHRCGTTISYVTDSEGAKVAREWSGYGCPL